MNITTLSNCLSVLFHLVLSVTSFAQDIAAEDTKSDLRFLQEKIIKYQPALEKYAPNFRRDSDMFIENIGQDSLTFLEYNKLVSKFCVLAKEGHFTIGTWEDTVRKGIPESTYRYLPINVVVLNNKVYLEADYSNEQTLEIGSEIKRINDQPIALILQEILYCMPSDGAIVTNIVDELGYAFPRNYYFFVEQPNDFVIELTKPDGSRHIAGIQALSKKEQTANFRKYILPNRPPRPSKPNPVYTLDIQRNYAHLTLRSFNKDKLKDQEIVAKKFYKAIFDTLKQENVPHLVVDLRGNLGGKFVMAAELVPYLMQTTPKDRFQRKSVSWKGIKKRYRFRKKSRNAFKGTIYVLIDGSTFSSASTLARYLKEETEAVLIGEETGSRYEGFAAGSKQFIFLPNTGIRIGIPRYLIEFGPGEEQHTRDRGVLPDYSINYTIDDVLNKKDLHLKKALEIMKETL